MRIFWAVFICSFSILRNSQLESDVCRLPYTWSLNSLLPFCSYFQIIVTPLKEKDDPGNTADAKYETVDLTYEDQEEGKPYITAEFAKGLFTTEFPVGDGKYYSRDGVTDSKRKRRAAGKLALNLGGHSPIWRRGGMTRDTKQGVVFVVVGSLSNDNDNAKSNIEFISKTTALLVHHAF